MRGVRKAANLPCLAGPIRAYTDSLAGISSSRRRFLQPAAPSEQPRGRCGARSAGSRSASALEQEIADFVGQPTPLRLQDTLAMQDHREMAILLLEELPLRYANRIAHLDNLPYLDEVEELHSLRATLVQSFQEVRSVAKGEGEEDFGLVVRNLKARHRDQAQRITAGMRKMKELRMEREGVPEEELTVAVDQFLNRFFLSRIGIEMLTSQYLALCKGPGSGIVDRQCDPCMVSRKAADIVSKIAKQELKVVPRVDVSFHGIESARTLPLVSSYLFYIVVELLKNSFRAVGEQYGDSGIAVPPPITVRVSSDPAQVALQIFDRGGGIPFEHQPHIWSYQYSSKRGPKEPGKLKVDGTPLAGFGVGLPLSRLYAEYIGGQLHLMSMPNFGTHAFLFLSRSSSRKEKLPTYVNWLRARQLRESLRDLNTKKNEAAAAEDYAEALRLKTMMVEVKGELASIDSLNSLAV